MLPLRRAAYAIRQRPLERHVTLMMNIAGARRYVATQSVTGAHYAMHDYTLLTLLPPLRYAH